MDKCGTSIVDNDKIEDSNAVLLCIGEIGTLRSLYCALEIHTLCRKDEVM